MAARERIVSARAVVQDVPQARDVARVLADQQGRQLLLDAGAERRAGADAADCGLGLAEADGTTLRLDAHQVRSNASMRPKSVVCC